MKVIKSDISFLIHHKIFSYLQANVIPLILWQKSPSGKRAISVSRLISFDVDSKLLELDLEETFYPVTDLCIYGHAEMGNFIFKTNIKEHNSTSITLFMPEEIRMVEESDIQRVNSSPKTSFLPQSSEDFFEVNEMRNKTPGRLRPRSARDQDFIDQQIFSLSLDEEDEIYADQRESPRSRPKESKFVKIMGERNTKIHFLKLFDLSQGGIGFVTMEDHLFPKGSMIKVMGFEDFDLDDPLIGQVMSHRAIDDLGLEYKIGCKFEE